MSEPSTASIPESPCRTCGAIVEFATTKDDSRPSPGDLSICFYCRTLSVFGDDLRLREPTDEEWIEIAGDEDVKAVTGMVAAVKP